MCTVIDKALTSKYQRRRADVPAWFVLWRSPAGELYSPLRGVPLSEFDVDEDGVYTDPHTDGLELWTHLRTCGKHMFRSLLAAQKAVEVLQADSSWLFIDNTPGGRKTGTLVVMKCRVNPADILAVGTTDWKCVVRDDTFTELPTLVARTWRKMEQVSK